MNRSFVDRLVSATGAIVGVVLLAAAGLLFYAHSYVHGQVTDQLREQQISFPAAGSESITSLPQADQAIAEFAAEARKVGGDSVLSVLHALLERVHEGIEYDDRSSTTSTTTAAEAFALKRGICQDFTHVFISAARSLAIPARYIGGHFFRADGAVVQEAAHAWAEAFVPDLGWVAFDAANGLCATDAHVRVAVGLDYLGAAPTRGARYGGGEEALDVTVRVSCPFDASQSQSQSQS